MTAAAARRLAAGCALAAVAALTPAGASPARRPAPALDLALSADSVTLAQHVAAGPASAQVTITNPGTTPVTITSITRVGSTAWTYVAAAPCAGGACTLAPGAAFTLAAMFDPATIGPHDAVLQIASSVPASPTTVTLAGTGQGATLALASDLGAPPVLALGTAPLGTTLQRSLQLRNDGNIALPDLALTLAPDGGAFALLTASPTSIPAAGARTVGIACTPTAAGETSTTLTLASAEAVTGSPLAVEVTCRGTAGDLFAEPAAIELGEVRIGAAPRLVEVDLKTSGPALTITSGPTLAPAAPGLTLTPPATTAITTTAPARLTLALDPTIEADLASTIAVTASGGAMPTTLDVPITGRVVTPSVDAPDALDAGSFCVGQPTAPSTATLTATGTASVELPAQPVLALMATSPFQLTYSAPVSYPYRLRSSDVARVEVTPLRQDEPGEQADDLLWSTDVPGDLTVRTRVTARFLRAGGAISPVSIDFGGVPVRTRSAPRLVRLQNCADEALALSPPTLDPAGEFVDASPTPLPAALEPRQLATLEIAFEPRGRGPRVGALVIDSSAGPLTVALRGDGTGEPTTPADATSFYACGGCGAGGEPASALGPLLLAALARRRRR